MRLKWCSQQLFTYCACHGLQPEVHHPVTPMAVNYVPRQSGKRCQTQCNHCTSVFGNNSTTVITALTECRDFLSELGYVLLSRQVLKHGLQQNRNMVTLTQLSNETAPNLRLKSSIYELPKQKQNSELLDVFSYDQRNQQQQQLSKDKH